jgi:SAM-dependent methyltransferase
MLNDCPFCHHSKAILFKSNQRTKNGSAKNIYKCDECGILYPRPRLGYQESVEAFSGQDTNNRDLFNGKDPLSPVHKDDYVVKLLRKYTPLKGDALDIGAFDGRFCYILESIGYKSYGIETQENVAKYARQKGLRVFTGAFPQAIPEDLAKLKFDLITVMEALYYFIDLRESLFKIGDMIKDDGFLLVKCHQGNSRYYDKNSYFFRYGDAVQGIPTVSSLKYCLEKSGFRIAGVQGEDLPDLMPLGIGSMRDSFPKRVFAKIYNSFLLQYTLVGISKADRITVIAERGGKT